MVPLALLDEPWAQGRRLIVLEPRRIAARAAAARMAWSLGEPVGETVGFRVRMQSKVSARTRVEVVTEGVFTRMILDDPGLDGGRRGVVRRVPRAQPRRRLGLAFARDAQGVLREDLRLLVMSATHDGARVAALLGEAPVIRSEGRAFAVDTRYLGRDPAQRLEDQTARAVRKALAEETGGVLVFLPGQGEIRRTEALLAERLPAGTILAPLYGALDPGEQDQAIEPAPPPAQGGAGHRHRRDQPDHRGSAGGGRRRLRPRSPLRSGQRPDPAGDGAGVPGRRRPAPGPRRPHRTRCLLPLWDEPETRALVPFARPEILETDLSGFALAWPSGAPGTRPPWPSSTSRPPAPSPRRGACCGGWTPWTTRAS